MAYRAFLLPSAEKELGDIISYLASYSSRAASRFLAHYEKQLELLCGGAVEYSLSRMPELAALEYHTALLDKHLFLYYIEDGKLVIAHFFHQRQDYASLVLSERIK